MFINLGGGRFCDRLRVAYIKQSSEIPKGRTPLRLINLGFVVTIRSIRVRDSSVILVGVLIIFCIPNDWNKFSSLLVFG